MEITEVAELQKQIVDLDTRNWIKVPYESTDGKYSLIFDSARLSCNSAVEKAAKSLEIKCQNTSEDSLGRDFIGNINQNYSLMLNSALGNKTWSFREFVDSLRLLYQCARGNIKAYHASGKPLDSGFAGKIFGDIVVAKAPLRGEWLDAKFDNYFNYNHKPNADGKLVPQNTESFDKESLMKDRKISLLAWINLDYTEQGFPSENVKEGDFHFYYPRKDKGTRVVANSALSYISCGWYPHIRSPDLGLRAVRKID